MSEGTTLAKAYVQIMPSAQGISGKINQMLGGEVSSAGDSAGKSLGSSLVGALKGVIVAAGIGATIKEAISAGGELEQSIGGIQKLFGTGAAQSLQEYADSVHKSVDEVKGEFDTLQGSQNTMISNAKQAYKTAGLSANDYMQTATSFGASLLQSLGGDTQLAAEKTDLAIQDMADNWNTFGSNQEDIMNAYKGFSKQNYTMLDNLKLGYGGTKAEMERLLADAQKISGVKYDISNLADVYDAIHVIQGELNITGTTSREAATTLEGSSLAMKAAWQNLLADLALGNDIKDDLSGLTTSIGDFLQNILRMTGNVLKGIPTMLNGALPGIITGLRVVSSHAPEIMSEGIQFVTELVTGITSSLPYIIEAAANLVMSLGDALTTTNWSEVANNILTGISDGLNLAAGEILGVDAADIMSTLYNGMIEALPQILQVGTDVVTQLVDGITSAFAMVSPIAAQVISQFVSGVIAALPQILQAGTHILHSIVGGINSVISTLSTTASSVIGSLVGALMANLPQILASGVRLLAELIAGIYSVFGNLVVAAGKIILSFTGSLISHLPDLIAAGITLVGDIIVGLIRAIPKIIESAKKLAKSVIDTFKNTNWLEVGKNIIDGIVNGLRNAAGKIADAAKDAAKKALKAAKETLGIHSPSRVFKNEVGAQIPPGIAGGIKAKTKAVTDAMNELSKQAVGQIDPDKLTGDFARIESNIKLGNDDSKAIEVLNEIMGVLTSYMPALAERQVVLDTGAMVGELANPLDRALGELQRYRGRL